MQRIHKLGWITIADENKSQQRGDHGLNKK